MSQRNVEIVRRIYEDANRGDFDAAIEYFAPEIEIHLAGLFLDVEPVHRGREALRKFVQRGTEAWDDISIEPDRMIDMGARVLVLAHFHVKGRDGIEAQRPIAHLWTMQNGQAVQMEAYSDQQAALEAVGQAKPQENVESLRA